MPKTKESVNVDRETSVTMKAQTSKKLVMWKNLKKENKLSNTNEKLKAYKSLDTLSFDDLVQTPKELKKKKIDPLYPVVLKNIRIMQRKRRLNYHYLSTLAPETFFSHVDLFTDEYVKYLYICNLRYVLMLILKKEVIDHFIDYLMLGSFSTKMSEAEIAKMYYEYLCNEKEVITNNLECKICEMTIFPSNSTMVVGKMQGKTDEFGLNPDLQYNMSEEQITRLHFTVDEIPKICYIGNAVITCTMKEIVHQFLDVQANHIRRKFVVNYKFLGSIVQEKPNDYAMFQENTSIWFAANMRHIPDDDGFEWRIWKTLFNIYRVRINLYSFDGEWLTDFL